MVGEDAKSLVEAEAEQQVHHHVLQEDDRRLEALKHLHLGIDQQGGDAFDVLLGQRHAAAHGRIEQPLVGQEALDCPEHAVVGHRVGVLVGVRHAREKLIVLVTLRIGTPMVADLGNAVVRGAHEGLDTLIVGGIKDIDDGLDILKAHRLGTRLVFGHVVDAEKLVVTEQQTIHGNLRIQSQAKKKRFLRLGAAASAAPQVVAGPRAASATMVAITSSVATALANEFTFSVRFSSMQRTK